MTKWDDNVIKRLLELKVDHSESETANILSKEFPEYEYSKDSAGNKYRRIINGGNYLTKEEEQKEFNKLSKQVQRFQDINRIERGTRRNLMKYEIFFEDYCNELITLLKEKNFESNIINHKETEVKKIGIIQLSDLHFNEIVSLPENRFDFDIASKRLEKLANKAKLYFKTNGITNILIACVGDFINSDRRLDELLSMATNRARAVFIATKILEQFILDLNKDFNIDFSGVTGNESRIQKDLGFSDLAASDSYDMTVYNMLRYLLQGDKIRFYLGNPNEIVINILGQNILLLHGNNFQRDSSLDKKIADIISKYNSQNINIRFTILGHFHSTMISNNYARGASLVGANTYSSYNLQYGSRASQNIHIMEENGNIDSINIDLQEYESYEGYNIKEETEFFTPLSSSIKNNVFKI